MKQLCILLLSLFLTHGVNAQFSNLSEDKLSELTFLKKAAKLSQENLKKLSRVKTRQVSSQLVANYKFKKLACDTLSTTFVGGNGHNGNMFDITAIDAITITQFEGNLDGVSGIIKIYYKAGTYQGSETNPLAWTFIDSVSVTSNGIGVPTVIPLAVNVAIPAGQTYAFYITGNNTGGLDLDYTNGTLEGAVYTSNANLEIKEGLGVAYPFGSNFSPRIWNGIVQYCTGGGGGCTTTISTFPYNEDFEAEPLCASTCSTACALTGVWTNSLSDNIDWIVDEGGTPSTSTGPSIDNTTGSATGNYLYTEATGACSPSAEAILLGPCFNLTACSTPAINFYYHMFGSDMGTMFLEVEAIPGSGTWTTLWTLAGDQGDVWNLVNVSLIAYAGTTIQLRFRGVTGPSFQSDMAIDDINLACSACVPPTLTIATTDPTSCSVGNGSATVTASGGTPGYNYSWNTFPVQTTATATGLAAGTYIVTVTDANSCTATATTTLIAPTGTATLVMSGSDVSCFGGSDGSVSVAVTGGVSPYTYLWSTGAITSSISGLSPGTYTVTVTENNGCDNTSSVTIFGPSVITATFNTFDPTGCGSNDGSITANASGGTGSYSYQWGPAAGNQTTQTAINLFAGTYTVTITDANGCTGTATTTLVDPTGTAVLLMSGSDVSCFGGSDGSVSVAVTGGVSPYTYLWSTGAITSSISGLSPGIYTVTVTEANGCDNTNSVTIFEPTAITASFTSIDPSCGNNDGSVTIWASGGAGSYTYQWNPAAGNQTTQTAAGLFSGTYSVTVTDADNCTEVFSVNLSDFGAPTLSITITNVTCNGSNNGAASVSFISGGTPPYSYLWNIGVTDSTISGLPAGTYTLTVTDASGCKVIQDAVIIEPDLLTVSTNYGNTTGTNCDGQAIANVTGGTLPYIYLWNDPASQTTSTAWGLCMGSYMVTVTDANNCTTSGSVFVDSIVSGITNISTFNINFTVYPNPILNEATIAFELNKPSNVQLALYDLMGRRIELFIDKEESAGIHLQIINASDLNLTNGIYLVTLIVDREIYYSKVAILR
ncbi:MAG: T9SS type A sorting domain-containing protein [Bacteroidia bacterium]|nr:T9SS type A sorting domain-containing protein [Bacteroidia bacterium]